MWNCYVAAAYELTQMVLPSATLQNTPQSLGQRVCLCFTVSMRGCVRMLSRARVCRSLSVKAEKTVSHLSTLISGLSLRRLPALVKLLYSGRHLDYRITIKENTKRRLSAAKEWYLIVWVTDQSGADSREDSEGVCLRRLIGGN